MTFIKTLVLLIITISGVNAGNINNKICFKDQLNYNNNCYDLDNIVISDNKTYYLENDYNQFDFNKFDYENIYKFKFSLLSDNVISDNLNVLPADNIMLPVSNNQYIIKPILKY